jgi:hypothetical protein
MRSVVLPKRRMWDVNTSGYLLLVRGIVKTLNIKIERTNKT